jgi:hypothetical protein
MLEHPNGFDSDGGCIRTRPAQMIAIYKTKITLTSHTLPYIQHGYATPIEHENI